MSAQHTVRSLALVTLVTLAATSVRAQEIPNRLPDDEFWELVTRLSEDEGSFPEQYMSNEDSAHFAIPQLKQLTLPGGIYLGVGSEQNFTYIAATVPRMAFIIDIRRDNMLQHLLYKALFELSFDRADFVSRLFARPAPPGIDPEADVRTLFDAFSGLPKIDGFFEQTTREVEGLLSGQHGFQLSEEDRASLRRILEAMATAGPDTLQGFGDPVNPTYAELMGTTDLEGNFQSYLASEDSFRTVQSLEERNLVVPIVGNFAGESALSGVGDYLRDHNGVVTVFYVSNVERYLFDQGEPVMRFYANVAALPRDSRALFIRSVTSDISYRLGIPIPDQPAKWRTFLFSIFDGLRDFEDGRVGDYRQLFEVGFRDRVNQPPDDLAPP